MFRKLLIVAIPLAALFGPLAYYSGPEWVSQATASLSPKSGAETPTEDSPQPVNVDAYAGVPLEGDRSWELWEVLRFDLSPSWVIRHWPRVSSSLHQMDLQGFRVPLVTGTAEDDLAGSITYYFRSDHRMQRISFTGTTGDYRPLVQLLTTHYGFVNRPTNAPHVIVFEVPSEGRGAASYLWIQPADVFRADEPLKRFSITLELQRPG